MRTASIRLASVFLAFASLVAALLAGQESMSAQFVSEATLARVIGTNAGQKGNGSYSCDDVNSTGSGQVTQEECAALTTVVANQTCVKCVDVNGSGPLTNGQGGNIVFAGSYDCTDKNQGSRLQTSPCEISAATGHGYCVDFIVTGQCTGSFNQWKGQVIGGN